MVLGSKPEDVETRKPQTRELNVNLIADSLSVLTFLFTLRRCQVILPEIHPEYLPKQVYIYKPKNLEYIKQWIKYHFKTYISLETLRCNSAQCQLNNEGGGELHQIKRSRAKTEIGKEIRNKIVLSSFSVFHTKM